MRDRKSSGPFPGGKPTRPQGAHYDAARGARRRVEWARALRKRVVGTLGFALASMDAFANSRL
jgi:hypothetical protein